MAIFNFSKRAKASAVIYIIVETAKENHLDSLKYLTYVLEKLPLINLTENAALDALMLCRIKSQPTATCLNELHR